MTHLRIIIALALALLFVPSLVPAQPFNPFGDRGVELLSELELTPKQKQQIKTLLTSARKESIKIRADIDIAGVDLRSELEKDAPDEKAVGALIEKVSGLEGKMRKSRVVSWLRVRKLLTAKQRAKLEGFDSFGMRGSLSDPFSHARDAKRLAQREIERAAEEIERAAEEIERAFEDDDLDGDLTANPFSKRKAKRRGCDEVTCLVDPSKACCRLKGEIAGQLKSRKDKKGSLTIAAKRPAAIYIDGKKIGMTPIFKHSLAPGKHKIKVVYTDGTKTKHIYVVSKPGKHRKIVIGD
jgi:Spy/CpxP family protein refolding chaperone